MTESLLDHALVANARATLKDKFPRIVGYYIDDMPTYIMQIQIAFEASNRESLLANIRKIIASSQQLGAMRVALLAQDIEEYLDDKTFDEVDHKALKARTEELEKAVEGTIAAMQGLRLTR